MTQLVIMLDKQITKRISLTGVSITLGRHPKCGVVLPDRTISAQHARITMVREDCFLEDLDSTNGTYVNQQHIDRHLLEDQDVISLGKYRVVFLADPTHGAESQIRRLSVHPKLMEPHAPAWLRVLDGRKAGYLIPLQSQKTRLGNQQLGKMLIERSAHGEYLLYQGGGGDHPSRQVPRKLMPGDQVQFADVNLQFCVKQLDV